MPINNIKMSNDRADLLAVKRKILNEIQDCEKTIEHLRSNTSNKFVYDDDSSGSEDDFSLSIDPGPPITQLKLQQSNLQTCLQATQELTNVLVLQSEVTMLVNDPDITGESALTEQGSWREVTAECRIDLVPFSIMFYVHQPLRKFSAPSYRGLRVIPVKSAHEVELSKSVLPNLVRPSDAVEVLKSYSVAYRSRRTTLARLADKYSGSLFMEPMEDGGYILKCANVLEMSWTLENNKSPVAPFHHKMKFDLEYMDESYITKISQTHRQLSNPTLSTDERTLILAKIITTCLEAKGNDVSENTDSEIDTNAPKGAENKVVEDKNTEIMAPPKSLPKKVKSNASKGVKRSTSGVSDSVKRMKMNVSDKENVASNRNSVVSETIAKSVEKVVKRSFANVERNAEVQNDEAGIRKSNFDDVRIRSSHIKKSVTDDGNARTVDKIDKVVTNQAVNDKSGKQNENEITMKKPRNSEKTGKKNTGDEFDSQNEITTKDHNTNIKSNPKPAAVNKPKSVNKPDKLPVNNESEVAAKKPRIPEKSVKKNTGDNKTGKSEAATAKVHNSNEKINEQLSENTTAVRKPDKVTDTAKAVNNNVKQKEIKSKDKVNKVDSNEAVSKINVESSKNKNNIEAKEKHSDDHLNALNKKKQLTEVETKQKSQKNINTITKVVERNRIVVSKAHLATISPKNIVSKLKDSKEINKKSVNENFNDKNVKTSSANGIKKKVIPVQSHKSSKNSKEIANKNVLSQNLEKKSKIPQKVLSPVVENIQKNHLRISPRRLPTNFKGMPVLNKKKTVVASTNIPRLLKPVPKIK